MKILITGATGFLGSNLSKYLLNKGCKLILIKRSFSNISRISNILPNVVTYDTDIVPLDTVFKEHDIDIVIHTATDYGRSDSKTSDVIASNVVFPLNLLELLANSKESEKKFFINTDTFFNHENAQLNSYLNSYSLSKKYFLELAENYIRSKNNTHLINARLEHLYGPGDDSSKFSMQIIEKLMSNIEEILLTPGEQERDFIYIDDVVSAFWSIIQNKDAFSESIIKFQIGMGTSCSIKSFVELAKKITGSSSKLIFGAYPYRENEIFKSQANRTQLNALGWECKVQLHEGIYNIVEQSKVKR